MTEMRRNRKNSIRKERIVMIASSAFVLAALTLTGVYMKQHSLKSEDDGYSVDFAALEKNVEDKYQEIAQNNAEENMVAQNEAQENNVQDNNAVTAKESALQDEMKQANLDDDLDYMPLEAGSSLVEIPGLTDGIYGITEHEEVLENVGDLEEESLKEVADNGTINGTDEIAEQDNEKEEEAVSAQNIVVAEELHFSEEDGLVRPVTGDILMHYSMDGSIYFATLDQYKYNPAVMFAAEEGSVVTACAEGQVVEIYEDVQIGKAVTIDLGDGYQATYGQLDEVNVSVDSYVNAGDTIGSVAVPTKYYSVEGCNLYFQLTKDGVSVNPEGLFQE